MSRAKTEPVTLHPKRAFEIVEAVAVEYGFCFDDLIGPNTKQPVTRARHAAMAALRAVTHPDGSPRYSWPTIGKVFGRHHTTAMDGAACHLQRERRSNGQQAEASVAHGPA